MVIFIVTTWKKIKRIEATDNALDLIELLAQKFGELMFYQAGGCCEGTQPQCFEKGGFICAMEMFVLERSKDLNFGLIKIYLNIGNMPISL